MSCRVSLISSVRDPSGFRSVVICVLVLVFPAANLYTSFHGLEEVVRLQYSFHDCIFSLFICMYVCMYVCMCVCVCVYVCTELRRLARYAVVVPRQTKELGTVQSVHWPCCRIYEQGIGFTLSCMGKRFCFCVPHPNRLCSTSYPIGAVSAGLNGRIVKITGIMWSYCALTHLFMPCGI